MFILECNPVFLFIFQFHPSALPWSPQFWKWSIVSNLIFLILVYLNYLAIITHIMYSLLSDVATFKSLLCLYSLICQVTERLI